jgi:D-arabinose 1-dehydrogenase-like Zn-dependent alcohol dehydrogenase
LAQYGRWVVLGEITGKLLGLNLAEVIFRDVSILGASGVSRSSLQQVASLVSQGRLKPVVSRVCHLDQAELALNLMANRKVLGRTVIVP